MNIRQILKNNWGYDSFRPLQEDIINSVLQGYDTLALMPTGGGKSICFQVPALAKEGICLVISPLIALMKDQVYNLQRRNIKAEAIFSGMSKRQIERILDNCMLGKVKFLYVSPERLENQVFQERLKNMNVCLVAIDEAHCISQWGYDFRPSYMKIADIRKFLPEIPFLALTATATTQVEKDIQEKLHFKEQKVFKKSFRRKNLSYSVFFEENKMQKLEHILKRVKGSGIVYVRNRKQTQDVAEILRKKGIKADYYHAGLNGQKRSWKQDAWIKNNIRIMVCTNAFGMGIDKPDVRVVVHIDLPESLEAYYQEAGRAGRDEKKAYAVLLYNEADKIKLKDNFNNSFPTLEIIRQTYQALGNHYQIAIGAGQYQSFNFDIRSFCQNYQLRPILAFNSLKLLEESGYVEMSEAVFSPSKLMFIVNREEIYKVEVAHRNVEPYLKAILRTYGGVFEEYIAIDERVIGKSLRTSVKNIVQALKYLHKYKLLDYIPQTDKPRLTFLRERVERKRLKLDQKLYDFRKEVRANNIKAVISYADNSERCRSQQLVAYFGELKSETCNVCDICLERKKKGTAEADFDKLGQIVKAEIKKYEFLSIYNLTQKLEKYRPEKLIDVVRWLIDNEAIEIDKEENLRIKN
ncbi:MAG: RecQ family ATP-dependent DNA helicase [Chitinophagales bacterium]